jgi:hypothetical protein
MEFSKKVLIIVVLLVILATRLAVSFSEGHLEHGESYLSLRLIDQFSDFRITSEEELTYNGELSLFFPAFYILQWPLHLIQSDHYYTIVPKLVTNLSYTACALLIFGITYYLTKQYWSSLFVSLISGFIPIFLSKTVFEFTPLSLFIPVFLLMIYFFLRFIDSSNYFLPFILSVLALCFISLNSYILIPIFVLFYILIKLDAIRLEKRVLETILLSSFIVLWVLITFLRPALEIHGASIVFQNIPATLVTEYFSDFNLFASLYNIGLFVVVFGLFTVYKVFDLKETKTLFLVSILFSVILLLFLTAIPLAFGLVIISLILCIFLSQFFYLLDSYLSYSKIASHKAKIRLGIASLVFFSVALPAVAMALTPSEREDTLRDEEYRAFLWMRDNLHEDGLVLSSYREADAITAIARKPTLLGSDFLLVEDIDSYFSSTRSIYQTISETQALRLLTSYNISYLYVSPKVLTRYSIDDVSYLEGSDCFAKLYDNYVRIYEINCVMEPLIS